MQSDELREMIAIERDQIDELVSSIERVVQKIGASSTADFDYVVATGAYLQSLYVGFEKVLVLIAAAKGTAVTKSDRWHAELLDLFTASNRGNLLPLLDDELRLRLDEMRGFRHLFRNSYSQHLQWVRLEPVASTARTTSDAFWKSITNAGL